MPFGGEIKALQLNEKQMTKAVLAPKSHLSKTFV